jgi:DNA-binding NarL/FixJ family response regulator
VIRVLVADDQELIREGLVLILDAQPDIRVVGTAADGVEAVTCARACSPDVVLMDVRMPRLDGIEATRRILAATPQCRVLVLTILDSDEHVLGALRAGASGFLLKDTPRRSLIAAVRAVVEGDVLLDRELTRRLVREGRPSVLAREATRLRARLTEREVQVLQAVARGLSNTEIAAELFIGEATVKSHVGKLLEKLAARDRVQLAVLAHTSGLASSAALGEEDGPPTAGVGPVGSGTAGQAAEANAALRYGLSSRTGDHRSGLGT